MNIKLVLVLTLTALLVVFTVQNAAVVETQFFFWAVSMPRSVLLLAVLVLGIGIGWVLCKLTGMRRRRASAKNTPRSRQE